METSNDWITDCSSNCFNHIAHYRTRYKSGATWRNRADQGSRYPIREEEPTNKPKAAVKVATAPPAQNPYIPPTYASTAIYHTCMLQICPWSSEQQDWGSGQGCRDWSYCWRDRRNTLCIDSTKTRQTMHDTKKLILPTCVQVAIIPNCI